MKNGVPVWEIYHRAATDHENVRMEFLILLDDLDVSLRYRSASFIEGLEPNDDVGEVSLLIYFGILGVDEENPPGNGSGQHFPPGKDD